MAGDAVADCLGSGERPLRTLWLSPEVSFLLLEPGRRPRGTFWSPLRDRGISACRGQRRSRPPGSCRSRCGTWRARRSGACLGSAAWRCKASGRWGRAFCRPGTGRSFRLVGAEDEAGGAALGAPGGGLPQPRLQRSRVGDQNRAWCLDGATALLRGAGGTAAKSRAMLSVSLTDSSRVVQPGAIDRRRVEPSGIPRGSRRCIRGARLAGAAAEVPRGDAVDVVEQACPESGRASRREAVRRRW